MRDVLTSEAGMKELTISRHAHCETLPETALLASVSVNPHNGAGLILQTFLVLDVLLDAAPEETLQEKGNTRLIRDSWCIMNIEVQGPQNSQHHHSINPYIIL